MPAVAAPSLVRPGSFGSSPLMRSNDLRARSCGSIRRSPKRELSTPPGTQLAPIESRLPMLECFSSQPDLELYPCRSPAPLPSMKCNALSSASESLVEWNPKKSAKLPFKTKAFDFTKRICMTIPRSLSFHSPKSTSSSASSALARLSWAKQINPRVEGPSGLLLRLENLRKAAIRLHSELQKNRFSLQVMREQVQKSKSEIDGEQFQALPSSPVSQTTPKSKETRKDLDITCTIDMPIYTAELKTLLDAEAEHDKLISRRV